MISNFHRVLYVVCFLLGNSPASEFYMPTFRNTLFHLHRQVGVEFYTYMPMKMEQTECSETSAYKIQTTGNYPEENIQQTGTFINVVLFEYCNLGGGSRFECWSYIKKNSVALVRERTIPTERPLPVGEVSANFCG